MLARPARIRTHRDPAVTLPTVGTNDFNTNALDILPIDNFHRIAVKAVEELLPEKSDPGRTNEKSGPRAVEELMSEESGPGRTDEKSGPGRTNQEPAWYEEEDEIRCHQCEVVSLPSESMMLNGLCPHCRPAHTDADEPGARPSAVWRKGTLGRRHNGGGTPVAATDARPSAMWRKGTLDKPHNHVTVPVKTIRIPPTALQILDGTADDHRIQEDVTYHTMQPDTDDEVEMLNAQDRNYHTTRLRPPSRVTESLPRHQPDHSTLSNSSLVPYQDQTTTEGESPQDKLIREETDSINKHEFDMNKEKYRGSMTIDKRTYKYYDANTSLLQHKRSRIKSGKAIVKLKCEAAAAAAFPDMSGIRFAIEELFGNTDEDLTLTTRNRERDILAVCGRSTKLLDVNFPIRLHLSQTLAPMAGHALPSALNVNLP